MSPSGIFSDSLQRDVATVSYIVEQSLRFFKFESHQKGISIDFDINATSDFQYISVTGGRILSKFLYPTALQRVATLLLLCNACPPFSLFKNGKPWLDINGRKEFLSRFTCLLIQSSLSILGLERDGKKYSLQWNGFPDEYFCTQFLIYLQWTDSLKVIPNGGKHGSEDVQEAFERIIAHLSLGCAMAMVNCVKESPMLLSD
jgi:hypothetical protein